MSDYRKIGTVRAVLASARGDEMQRGKQLSHPVTHKIIMSRSPDFDIMPGDVFELAGRRFYHTAIPYDVGGLGHFTIFYCDERMGAS